MKLNILLIDGTVRCGDCLDSSSIQGVTITPCTYCSAVPNRNDESVFMPDDVEDEDAGFVESEVQPAQRHESVEVQDLMPGDEVTLTVGWSDLVTGTVDEIIPSRSASGRFTRSRVRMVERCGDSVTEYTLPNTLNVIRLVDQPVSVG